MDPSPCCENAFHTESKYEVVVRTESVCCPCVKFLLDVFVLLSGGPLSTVVVVVSDEMDVELCFRDKSKEFNNFFPPTVGSLSTSPGDVHRVLGEDHIRFLLC